MTEVKWKQIKDQPNYVINTLGVIKNKQKNRILKPVVNSRGYCVVYLSTKGHVIITSTGNKGRIIKSVHRLVWETFKGHIKEGYHIDHIDGDKQHNALSNLRMCTPSENYRNSVSRSSSGYKGVYKQRNSDKCNGIILLPVRDSAEEAANDYNLAIMLLTQHNNFKSLKYNRLNFGDIHVTR